MKPRTRWILPGLAIVMLIAIVRVGVFGQPHSAASLLDSATQRLGRREPDFDGALRQLGLALELALEADDHEIAQEILLKRARAYRLRGDHDLAFADAERLLLDYTPDDPDILALACQMALEGELPGPALEYASRFLDSHPTNALASLLVGDAHSMAAEEELAAAEALMREALADADAALALRAANRAAALPFGDPRRLAPLDALDTLLGTGGGKLEVFRNVERATEALDQARQAYCGSLADGLEPQAVEGLLAIAARSERREDAVLLGRAFLAAPPAYSPKILLSTVGALRAQGRDPLARQVVARMARSSQALEFRRMKAEELSEWLVPLYELALWKELDQVASILGARSRQVPEIWRPTQVYWGTALLRRRNPSAALASFERAFRGKSGALSSENRALAWIGIAEASRKLGEERDELAALNELIRVPLDEVTSLATRAEIGEAMHRLAEHALAREDPARAELLYTRAMSLLPKRLERIQPRWEEAGRRALAEQGRTFRDERGRIERPYPDRRAGPYELWLYAESYLRQKKPYRCLTTTDRLLGDHPDFPLGLRAAGEAHLAKGDLKRGAAILVDYLEAGGPEEDVRHLLEAHPFEEIPAELKGRLLRAAPHVAGTVPVARELVAQGREELALASLERVEPSELSPEGRLLRARLASQLGRWEDANEILVDLPAESPLYGKAAGLAIQAAIKGITRGARVGTLRRAIAKVRKARDLDFPELLGAADSLLAHGHEGPAIELLEELDSRYSFFRGEVVMRLAVGHVVRGDFDPASQYIARAEPFFEGPEAAIGRLAIAADVGSWDAWDLAVREVLAHGFPDQGFGRLLAIALQGHHATAIEAIDAEVVPEDDVPDPRPMLLRLICEAMLLQDEPTDDGTDLVPSRALQDEPFIGRPGEGRDPRHALTLLAALEHPSWAAWAVARLRALRGAMGRTSWPMYLVADGLHRLGQTDHAEQLLRRLTNREPPVPFAWLLLERITRERAGDDTPELLALRRDRIDSFGPLGLGERDRALVLAFVYELVGNDAGALQVLEEARRTAPGDLELALRVARKLGEGTGTWEAIQAYDQLLVRVEEDTRRELIPEYLDLLRRAAEGGELSDGAWWALLESLETQIPDDPSIARELAARTIDTAAERADWGVHRAWERLERFRRRTGDAPVDALRPGEAERWFELYAAHDPELALRFAAQELDRMPTRPSLWLLLARGQLALGRTEEAVATIDTITTIVPDPDLLRFRAHLSLFLPENPKRIRDSIDEFLHAAGLGPEDPEMLHMRGIWMTLSEDPAAQNRGLQMLTSLYEAREEGIDPVDPRALGTELVLGLLERSRETDLPTALEVARSLEETEQEPLRREVLSATRALAEHMSLLAEEEPAPGPKKKKKGSRKGQRSRAQPADGSAGEPSAGDRASRSKGGGKKKRARAGGGGR